jgi:hypothetical protein
VLGLAFGLVLLAGIGCEGGGLAIQMPAPDSGDQPGGGGGGGGDNGGGGGGGGDAGDTRFAGNWLATFSDDRTTASAPYGQIQYAILLNIRQRGTGISGNGTLFRVFREGPTASNRIAVQMSGTTSGDDATFTLRSGAGGLDREQTWYVRLGMDRMAGMYLTADNAGTLSRSGHALWHKATSNARTDVPWAAAYTDEFGIAGFPQRSRTVSVTPIVEQTTLRGSGTMYEHVSLAPELNFDLVRGGVSGSEIGFTFGGLDLIENEVDWFGFFGGNIMVTAYGQFDASDALIRSGHTVWVPAPERELTAITGAWAGSFRDRTVEKSNVPGDFTAVFHLTANDGGAVTGYALMRNEADDSPDFQRYNIDNGSIIGTQVQLSMSRLAGSFFWDLRLCQDRLVGSYQRFAGSQNRLVGTGHAEFRTMTSAGVLRGTWRRIPNSLSWPLSPWPTRRLRARRSAGMAPCASRGSPAGGCSMSRAKRPQATSCGNGAAPICSGGRSGICAAATTCCMAHIPTIHPVVRSSPTAAVCGSNPPSAALSSNSPGLHFTARRFVLD